MDDVIFYDLIYFQDVKTSKISVQSVYNFRKNFQGSAYKSKSSISVMWFSKASFFATYERLRDQEYVSHNY